MSQEIIYFESYEPVSRRLTVGTTQAPPLEISQYAHEVEVLDVSHGGLVRVSLDFTQFARLKTVFFSHNPLTELHPEIVWCPSLMTLGFRSCHIARIAENALPTGLHWLILTDNKLMTLPTSMGKLTQLRKLSLSGNQLTALPAEMRACRNLELVRLGANNFKETPEWILTLPQLAWYGGINHRKSKGGEEDIFDVPYRDVTLGELIGSSPSSEVWRAMLDKTGQDVAVKIYKGQFTSDGWPEDDMRMSIAAGAHPNLIPVLGKLVGHPEQKHGLVFEYIPSSFRSLGLPPSLESCTRDTFPVGTSWSSSFILRVLRGVASACQHLHSKGIIHGDVYAHNILVNDEGDCYLGDFGAASFYDRSTERQLEQIEVRAFGYLVEDLLGHSVRQSSLLEQLKNSCLNPDISARPLFADIISQLHDKTITD